MTDICKWRLQYVPWVVETVVIITHWFIHSLWPATSLPFCITDVLFVLELVFVDLTVHNAVIRILNVLCFLLSVLILRFRYNYVSSLLLLLLMTAKMMSLAADTLHRSWMQCSRLRVWFMQAADCILWCTVRVTRGVLWSHTHLRHSAMHLRHNCCTAQMCISLIVKFTCCWLCLHIKLLLPVSYYVCMSVMSQVK